jgi:hypothetical protein
MLALVFFTMATISHSHESHEAHGAEAHGEHHGMLSDIQIDAPPVA